MCFLKRLKKIQVVKGFKCFGKVFFEFGDFVELVFVQQVVEILYFNKFQGLFSSSSMIEDICRLGIILQYSVSRKLKKVVYVRLSFEGFRFNCLNYFLFGVFLSKL